MKGRIRFGLKFRVLCVGILAVRGLLSVPPPGEPQEATEALSPALTLSVSNSLETITSN